MNDIRDRAQWDGQDALPTQIAVVVTGKPTDGGKFQYARTIVEALTTLAKRGRIRLAVVAANKEGWQDLVDATACSFHWIRRPIPLRLLRRAILMLPWGLRLWRRINPAVDVFMRGLKEIDASLVFYPGNETLGYDVAQHAMMPIHDLMHRYERRFPEVGSPFEFRNREKHYRTVVKYADGILVDSEMGKKHVIESYAAEPSRIHVLPFIAPPHLATLEGKSDLLTRFQVPEKFVFYPAQFWRHKNHLGLIRALALLAKGGVTVPAVFVGSPKNAGKDIQHAIGLNGLENQVRILPYVTDAELVQLYRKAWALVMPTFFGPTNIPPLEAFMLGCPVAISAVYGMKEQLGDAALYFDPERPEDIANAIERLWADSALREQLIAKGWAHAARWNSAQFIERLEEIIHHALRAN
jgi:glycosyltransferase involved in cell wall biosynthesis